MATGVRTENSVPRVTQLASGDLWAGAEAQLFAFVAELKSSGAVEVDVVLLNDGLLAQRLRDADVPVTVLDERRLGPVALVRALRAHVRKQGTDVLHTHRLKENVLGSVVALSRHGLRTMRTVHGASEHAPGPFDVRRRALHFVDWLCARFVQRPIICVSHPLASLLGRSVPPSLVQVITNGIDVVGLAARTGSPARLPDPERECRVGFFGRLTAVKRLDLVVEIASRLERSVPGRYGVYLFGAGPLGASLERMINERGLQGAVHLMGFVDEPAPYLRMMDVLLLTSDHEGLPMIVLEAMALNVPVVSRAVGEIPSVLANGLAGSLIEGEDPEEYAHVIAAQCADRALASERTERAYARVVAEYSVSVTAREYATAYRRLASGG